MEKAISAGREGVSDHAPRVTTITINKDKIREIIRPRQGHPRNLRSDRRQDRYRRRRRGQGRRRRQQRQPGRHRLDQVDRRRTGNRRDLQRQGRQNRRFRRLRETSSARDGLVHISELLPGRVNKTTDVVNVGDSVKGQKSSASMTAAGQAEHADGRPGNRRRPVRAKQKATPPSLLRRWHRMSPARHRVPDRAWWRCLSKPPHLIGHRGAAAVAPENTLASFRRAATDGADWVELMSGCPPTGFLSSSMTMISG